MIYIKASKDKHMRCDWENNAWTLRMFDEVTSKGTHRREWLSIKRKEIRPTELKPFQNIISK